jgi:predicted P-loop ATPase
VASAPSDESATPKQTVVTALHRGPRKSLFNVGALLERPARPVLFVEDELCAKIATDTLIGYATVAIPDLAAKYREINAPLHFKFYDLSPLKNRDVLLWPTADDDGSIYMATLGRHIYDIAKRVRVLMPQRSDGWNIAAAVREGWDAQKIVEWGQKNVRAIAAPQTPKTEILAPSDPESDYSGGSPPQSALVSWQDLGLAQDSKGVPHATIANASLILQLHPEFRNKLWLDSFRDKIYHCMHGAPRQWTDADTRKVCVWIQQQMNLPKMHLQLIQEAVLHAAESNARNSLTDWLDSLEWDGIERLDSWLFDCLGVDHDEYTAAVARNWPVSMVARAYKPGCKVDTMPVLEGPMGVRKSTFLDVLASPWYAALSTAFGDKDFLQAIQGRWLVEIPDMTGFGRREHTQILAAITTRVDVYRRSYGRHTEEHPRVTVFAATSETDEYLQDRRGRRRYWPLRCGAIDLDALHEQRPQIFAEAVAKYRAGNTWYEMPAQADEEQAQRAQEDLWTDRILDYADRMRVETPSIAITSQFLLTQAIELPIGKQGQAEKLRITRIMREGGWIRSRTSAQREWKKVERK